MKNVVIGLVFALSASGCAGLTSQSTPADVALIPNDCANMHRIVPWLESQLNRPSGFFQTNSQHQESIRAIKHRMWSIRYHCEPADDSM